MMLDHHVAGRSLRDIGKAQGRSGAWAHYRLHETKRKLRAKLTVIDGKKAA